MKIRIDHKALNCRIINYVSRQRQTAPTMCIIKKAASAMLIWLAFKISFVEAITCFWVGFWLCPIVWSLMVNNQLSTGFSNWVHSQAHLINASRLGITVTHTMIWIWKLGGTQGRRSEVKATRIQKIMDGVIKNNKKEVHERNTCIFLLEEKVLISSFKYG